MRAVRIGIDTGGTFTDVCVRGRDRFVVHKLPSTPEDPARAVLRGLEAVRPPAVPADVVHGTTVGLNAVLTGRVARTAFVTNRGFEDLIEIGRQARTSLYDLAAPKPVPPVPRRLRFGIGARVDARGRRVAGIDAGELATLRERIAGAGVEAIAIGLLHSHVDAADERRLARAFEPLGLPITCSAELIPRHGEFERFTAAILNAAISTVMGSYLGRLVGAVAPGRLRLMRSSAGIVSAAEAERFPARAMLSGPAGGVLATRALAQALREPAVAALDMGGTSTDVALVRREIETTESTTIGGLPLALPAVDVHTIGCGGGSIAFVDSGGALRVGPLSAGADPGPACYGKGDDPTVTDAHMVLGHLGAESLLGGTFPVDPDLSVRAVERLARRLGLSLRHTAEGILEVAEVSMVRALMVITVERAVDPERVPLVAYGGAGGLHALTLARRLSMPRAVVPPDPGAFSAVGLALAGESVEMTTAVLQPLEDLGPRRLLELGRDLRRRALRELEAGPGRARVTIDVSLRYLGQGSALRVPLRADAARSFRARHQDLYGFAPEDAGIEVVDLRARAERPGPGLPEPVAAPAARATVARPRRRRAPAGGLRWAVWDRGDLAVGSRVVGPCIVEELTGATRVPTGAECVVTPYGLVLAS